MSLCPYDFTQKLFELFKAIQEFHEVSLYDNWTAVLPVTLIVKLNLTTTCLCWPGQQREIVKVI